MTDAEGAAGAAPRVLAVAVDVDGTLLDRDHRVSGPTREAVEAVRAGGVLVVLASSRGPAELREILLGLGLTAPTPFIAAQGALTASYGPDGRLQVDAERRLPLAAAREVAVAADAAGIGVNWYDGERWIAVRLDAPTLREAHIVGHEPLVADPLAEAVAPHKLLLIAPDGRPGAVDGLLRWLPDGLAAHSSKPGYLDVTAAGVDKAVAFERLCAGRGIGVERRAAIGDGLNDLGLFAAVRLSVAMGHAPAAVRRQATMVTGSDDEHGAATALLPEAPPARPGRQVPP